MLRITKEQLKAIESKQLEHFIDLMVEYVKNNFPDKKELPELRKYVSGIVKKAEVYDYELETDYELFLDLHCTFAELNDDPLPPKLQNILFWPDREPAEKNKLLFNALKFGFYGRKS